MEHHTAQALVVLTLVTIGAATATADATTLPSLLQLAGITSGTLTAAGTTKTKFNGIVALEGTDYKFALTSNFEMTSLGPALLWFLNTAFGAKKCKANGDTAGNNLVPVLWHTVLAATGGGTSLFLILILISPSLTMECEGTNIVITGDELFNAEPLGKEVTTITAVTGKCTGNTPAFTNYLNDADTSTAAALKSETGGLKSATCLEVEGTQCYAASGMGVEVMES